MDRAEWYGRGFMVGSILFLTVLAFYRISSMIDTSIVFHHRVVFQLWGVSTGGTIIVYAFVDGVMVLGKKLTEIVIRKSMEKVQERMAGAILGGLDEEDLNTVEDD